jgi:ABC-type transport system involved in multi-copper enzyme maturation permease subunit
MPGIYPSFKESFESGLEGEENLEIVIPKEKGQNINLSWTPIGNNTEYIVIESTTISMVPATGVIIANEPKVSFPYDFNETRYYTVATINLTGINYSEYIGLLFNISNIFNHKFNINSLSNTTFIGMTSTSKDTKSAIDEFLENDMYRGFTGGRVISFSEIKGFVSLEFYSWWVLLAGLFLAYIAVSSLTSDFEGKRMDLIFSTPIKREQYLLEKFAALMVITIIIILFAAGALASGIESIGYSDELDSNTVFLSLIGSLPMLLVIMAIGFLTAVQFGTTRAGMGIAFMFIMIEFILYTLSGMSTVYENAKYATILHYWDYNSVLFDGQFNVGHFIGLSVVAGIILMLAVYLFKRKDIPA